MAGRPLRRLKNPEDTLVALNRLGSKAIGMYLYEPRTGENWVVARHGSSIVVRNCSTGQVTRDVSGLVFTKSNPGKRRNPGIGDYLRAGKKAAIDVAESAATEVRAATERARKAAAEETESRKLDSPEKALRVLAAAHGYELVKKNPPRTRKNSGCSCGGKCAPCASRKNRGKARKK